MDWDPDDPFYEGYETAQDELGEGLDRVFDPEDELEERHVFPDADDIGLAGSFAHMMQDERDTELPPDIDEQNYRQAMELCTASGEARQADQRPFEAYVRQCIDTPGFFRRRK